MSIDYGHGRTNIDHKTGIRYGVISQHDIMQGWQDSEPDYGKPSCPKCGSEATDNFDCDSDYEYFSEHGCADYACHHCQLILDSSEAYGDEPYSYSYQDDGYYAVSCLDSDVMVIESPFYTYAEFCSPCVPGAGNLNSYNPDGAKTYCFNHSWYDSGVAPYPVYSVATNAMVEPEFQANENAQHNVEVAQGGIE